MTTLLGLLLLAGAAAAEGEESPATDTEPHTSSVHLKSGREIVVFPANSLYPLYIADPHSPATGILIQSFTSTGIDQAGNQRFFLKLGGQFGLLRWQPRNPGGRAWQLNLDAGLDAQFDIDNRNDNIGWDGNYGLSSTTARQGGKVVWKLGILHTSSHLGDEWIKRTGRERINYTRQEALVGMSWRFAPRWRTYSEAGWGYDLSSDEMEPGRLQAGLDYRAPGRFWGGIGGWYAALDLSSWGERDGRLDTGFQGGLIISGAGNTWRLGIQYWDGRVPVGEFFQDTESNFTLGLWSEL